MTTTTNQADEVYASLCEREYYFDAHTALGRVAESMYTMSVQNGADSIYMFADGSGLGLGNHTDYVGNIFFLQGRN